VRTDGSGTVTRADIEAKLRQIRDSMEPVGEQAKASVMAIAPVAVAVIVLAAYLVGVRRGKKRRAVIEIRRI
jgi:hypothetical protein